MLEGGPGNVVMLNEMGKIPASLIIGMQDEVIEHTDLASFPSVGVSGVIYVDLSTNRLYRWSGTIYIESSPSPGSTDGLAEGVSNLYFTSARALAALASALLWKSNTGHLHAISDVNSLQSELDSKVDKVSGKGLSTNDYDNSQKSLVSSALQPSSLSSYALSSAVTSAISTAINNLINSAPGTLDTLAEIATQLAIDESVVSALTTVVNGKASATHMHTISEVTGLSAALSAKQNTIAAGAHIIDAATDAATNAPTNLNALTTILGTLTGEVNATNDKQNKLAQKYNDLAAKYNALLDRLEAAGILSAS